MKNVFNVAILAFLSVAIFSCSDDDSDSDPDNDPQGTSQISVRMVDAPGDYEAVFVEVEDVVVKYNDSEEEVSIGAVNTGVYDLLELTGGVSVLLVDDEVPAGNLSQIRLILGDDNTVVIDGETFPLNTPSAQQSGLKINVNETLENGVLYEFVLDFDVDASVVARGDGGYNLKPVIRATTVAETGAISGTVLPLGVQTLVTATNGLVTISSYTDASGTYVLSGVPEGTYDLTFEADADLDIPPITLPDVDVTVGNVTTVETIEFILE
ncbi:DUF4382 domain-containing protein [Altibacter sp. HG106]|uniref:DUF4382 domain-containing protein n=1 Tax=Altibacter sp. HG106 TaxID=3023937 RepID=UPI0023506E0B|nr:DUF4382 domain-containing protein [Altibacter sp. HG106]MDC7994881.1 DUF4382 domain-containing protein [Altibacter sp. HG106]